MHKSLVLGEVDALINWKQTSPVPSARVSSSQLVCLKIRRKWNIKLPTPYVNNLNNSKIIYFGNYIYVERAKINTNKNSDKPMALER